MWFKNLKINQKLIVDDLISFIITENCPFLCAHCMRGERRPNTITKEVIDAVLSQVEIKGDVHLGGGEPLLQSKMVAHLINEIYRLGNQPKEISVITNGSVGPKKFEEFISSLHSGITLNLTVSNDYYHKQERLRLNNGSDNILTRIREYQKIMCDYKFKRPIDDCFEMLENYESFRGGKGVLAIGRGKNIEGAMASKRDFKLHKAISLKKGHIKGGILVQADGRITTIKDMSWEERDEYYGQEYNILTNPFEKILKR